MADVLTAEERRLIDAFPKRRIQRIARGVSGLPTLSYDEDSTSAGGLVSSRSASDAVQASHRIKARHIRFRALREREKASKLDHVRVRRDEVMRLIAEGMSRRAVAERLGVSKSTVEKDITRMRGAQA